MVKFYATTIALASNANTDPDNGGHHKGWTGLENLANANGIAYCQHPDYLREGTGENEHSYIAGMNGTLKQPAPIVLSGFDFSTLNNATTISGVIVHYKQQTFAHENTVPSIGGATVTLMGANVSQTGTESITTTLTEQKISFNNITKAQLLSNDFKVKIAYPSNSSTNPGRIIIQDVYVEVLTGAPTTKYAQSVSITPGYSCGGNTHYKCWDHLNNLTSANGTANCRDPNETETPLIAGTNGTYKQPAPLTFTNFGFGFSSTAVIEKVELHYKTQKFENNGYYPDIGGATITLLGTNQDNKTGKAISSTKKEDVITWTGVTTEQVNSSSFGVKIAFPANTSTTPGRIILEDVYLKIYTTSDGVKLSLNTQFTKNPVMVSESFEGVFTVKKTSQDSYNSKTIIDLPLGVNVVSKTSGPGTCTVSTVTFESYSFKRITWNHTLASGSTSNQLIYELSASTASRDFSCNDATRIKKCTIKDNLTEVSYNQYLTINDISCTLSCTLSNAQAQLITERNNKYTAVVKTDDPTKCDKVLWVQLSNGGELDTSDFDFTGYDATGVGSNGNYWIRFHDTTGKSTIGVPIRIYYDDPGQYTIKLWVTPSGSSKHLTEVLTIPFLVREAEMGALAFTRLIIPELYTQNMGDNISYTLGSMIKYVNSSLSNEVTDYGSNLRIGVYNSEEIYVEDEYEFLDRVVWCKDIASSTSKEATVKFTYNENNPLYFVYSHMFVGDALNQYIVFNFSEPWLVETSYYNATTTRDLRIVPVKRMLDDSGYATGTFNTGIAKSIPIDTYKWNDGGISAEDISPLGIEILFDYIVSDKVWVDVQIYLDSKHVGSRDIILEAGNGTAHAGNTYDLFGLKPSDFKGKLEKMQIIFKVLNQVPNSAKVELNNARAIVKYVHRANCKYGFSVDGESSRDYGIVVTDIDFNFATNNEKTDYKVTGTDDSIINRLNVDSKQITIHILLPDCDLEKGIYLIDKVVEMFTNSRELNSNKPILKHLIFEHIPDREWPFVRVKEFDDEIVGTSYKAKITLEIPQGTSYDIEKTVTGARGSSPSSIGIKPEIYYKSTTGGRLIINETVLGQELVITDNRIKNGSLVTIDTTNRQVLLDGTTDISSSIDYNSNWFRIKGEYEFTTSTGIIQSVEYYIRR